MLLKKKEEGPETRFLFFFFNDSDSFLSILIQIVTYLATRYSQNVFCGFFYLGVHRDAGVFSWLFFPLLLSRVTRFRARLALASV